MACFNICRRSSFNPCDCECRRVCLAGATGPIGPTGPTGPTGAMAVNEFGYGYSVVAQTVNSTTVPISFTESNENNGVTIDSSGNVTVANAGVYEIIYGVGPSTAQADIGIWEGGALVTNTRVPVATEGVTTAHVLLRLDAGDTFYLSIAQEGETLTLTGTNLTAYIMVRRLSE